MTDYTAHSKGTAITANAIIDIINSGDGAILKGKKIRFHGSPLQLNKMEKLSNKILEEYKKDPNNPILLKLGEELYQEIERTNK